MPTELLNASPELWLGATPVTWDVADLLKHINTIHGTIGVWYNRPNAHSILSFVSKNPDIDYRYYLWFLLDFVGNLDEFDAQKLWDAMKTLESQYWHHETLWKLIKDNEHISLTDFLLFPPELQNFFRHTYHVVRFQTYCGDRHTNFESALDNKHGLYIKTPTQTYYLKMGVTKTIVNPNTCYMHCFSDWHMNVFFRIYKSRRNKNKHPCIKIPYELNSITPEDDHGNAAEIDQGICRKILNVPESDMEIEHIDL